MFKKVLFTVFVLSTMTSNVFAQTDALSFQDKLINARKGDARAIAEVAYCLKNGVGTEKNLEESQRWALAATEARSGLAYWILAQIAEERGEAAGSYRMYLDSALACSYPLALSVYARLYESGAAEYGIEKDENKAFALYEQAAEMGDKEAAAFLGYLYLRDNDAEAAAKYLTIAASEGDAESMSLLASLYSNGFGTDQDAAKAIEWYAKAAETGSSSGLEGLADCYRTGTGTAVNQVEALNLYSRIAPLSPRLQYILGYYYATGEGTETDNAMALSLLRQASASGIVYAQALLGIGQYEGSMPFDGGKDVGKALPFLLSAYHNNSADILPIDMQQKLYRYLSGFYRYGRGVDKDLAFAESLMKKAESLQSNSSTVLSPFAMIGMKSVKESMDGYVLNPLTSPYVLLKQVTFDYPVQNQFVLAPEFADVSQTATQVKKSSSGFTVFLEAVPYGFGPVSSEQIQSKWVKDFVSDFSVTAGIQGKSGAFFGAGFGYDRFFNKQLSILLAYLDGRLFIGARNRFSPFLEIRGGAAYETSKAGMGMQAGGGGGFRFRIQDHFSITAGVKASYFRFFNEASTQCSIIGPFVGVAF